MTLHLAAGVEPIPGYRLARILGRGGFGEVWEAEAPGRVRVALKFIPLDTAHSDPEQRALDTIREIRHPHLLEIHFATQVEDRLVIATSLCDQSLWDRFKEVIRDGLPGIPADELLVYIEESARALDFLNEPRHPGPGGQKIGVQHRDIKPHNIFLVGGSVKLADFGLAKVLERSVASHTGSMTPAYAPPEMFKGQVSPKSDQYSLAVTYYQLRFGELPFAGSPQEILYKALTDPPDLARATAAERSVLEKALAKDPRERFASCKEFADALKHAALVPAAQQASGSSAMGMGSSDPPARKAPHPQPKTTHPGIAAGSDTSRQPFAAALPTVGRAPEPADPSQPPPAEREAMAKIKRWRANRWRADSSERTSPALQRLALLLFLVIAAGFLSLPIVIHRRRALEGDSHGVAGQIDTARRWGTPGNSGSATKDTREVKAEPVPIQTGPVAAETLIRLAVDPPEAIVKVVGKGVALTGTGASRECRVETEYGRQTLEFSATHSGYSPLSRRLTPSPGSATELRLALEPLPAIIDVNLNPVDAILTVEGSPARTTGSGAERTLQILDSAPAREMTLVASRDGFREERQSTRIQPGGKSRVFFRLEPDGSDRAAIDPRATPKPELNNRTKVPFRAAPAVGTMVRITDGTLAGERIGNMSIPVRQVRSDQVYLSANLGNRWVEGWVSIDRLVEGTSPSSGSYPVTAPSPKTNPATKPRGAELDSRPVPRVGTMVRIKDGVLAGERVGSKPLPIRQVGIGRVYLSANIAHRWAEGWVDVDRIEIANDSAAEYVVRPPTPSTRTTTSNYRSAGKQFVRVKADRAEIKRGTTVLATVQKNDWLPVHKTEGDWYEVTATKSDGTSIRGFIHKYYVDIVYSPD